MSGCWGYYVCDLFYDERQIGGWEVVNLRNNVRSNWWSMSWTWNLR